MIDKLLETLFPRTCIATQIRFLGVIFPSSLSHNKLQRETISHWIAVLLGLNRLRIFALNCSCFLNSWLIFFPIHITKTHNAVEIRYENQSDSFCGIQRTTSSPYLSNSDGLNAFNKKVIRTGCRVRPI